MGMCIINPQVLKLYDGKNIYLKGKTLTLTRGLPIAMLKHNQEGNSVRAVFSGSQVYIQTMKEHLHSWELKGRLAGWVLYTFTPFRCDRCKEKAIVAYL